MNHSNTTFIETTHTNDASLQSAKRNTYCSVASLFLSHLTLVEDEQLSAVYSPARWEKRQCRVGDTRLGSEQKEKQDVKLREMCDTCGKPRADKARTNVTRFLFSESRCDCVQPNQSVANEMDASQALIEAPIDPEVIKELGDRYEVLSLLGKGGMGAVYKVRDKVLDKLFAIKVLKRELVEDAASVKRFEQEAKAASGLTHANLCAVYSYGAPASGSPFIVMDYLPGKNLAEILQKEGYLEVPRALDLFLQVSEAMAHAHHKGVVHRDIKPTNIIISTDDSGNDFAKLVDFGIAKVLPSSEKTQQQLTQTGEIFGSPLYMSPEQGLGEKLDTRSDIYSFGCVMYEVLTSAPPFAGLNPIQTIMKHINDVPPSMDSKNRGADVPQVLQDIIMRCLEKNPADRYQTADELLKDLSLLREGKTPKVPKRKVKAQPARFDQKKVFTVAVLSFAIVGLCAYIFAVVNTTGTARGTAGMFGIPVGDGTASGDAKNLDDLSFKYFSTGQYEKAIPLLQFGVQAYKDGGGKEDSYLADNLQHIGKCFLKLGKYTEAAPYYEDAMRIYRKFGNYRGSLMPECFVDYSEVLKHLDRQADLKNLQDEWQRNK